ncbi:MAG: hypothetical protein QME52_00410 [Bacteroidota bacterium]|nr:hypothetical protein [Bacteroidota bacterium]
MIFDKSVIFRFLIIALLAILAIVLFAATTQRQIDKIEKLHRDLSAIATEIDAEVDSILSQFHVELKKVRKRTFTIPNTNLNRIERRVTIPKDVDPLHINQALNLMAQKYDGRAIGSENLKENTVTIHIKLDGYILETLILKSRVEQKPIKRKK